MCGQPSLGLSPESKKKASVLAVAAASSVGLAMYQMGVSKSSPRELFPDKVSKRKATQPMTEPASKRSKCETLSSTTRTRQTTPTTAQLPVRSYVQTQSRPPPTRVTQRARNQSRAAGGRPPEQLQRPSAASGATVARYNLVTGNAISSQSASGSR